MAVTDQPGAEVSPQALFSALQGGRVPAELKGTSLAFELGDAPDGWLVDLTGEAAAVSRFARAGSGRGLGPARAGVVASVWYRDAATFARVESGGLSEASAILGGSLVVRGDARRLAAFEPLWREAQRAVGRHGAATAGDARAEEDAILGALRPPKRAARNPCGLAFWRRHLGTDALVGAWLFLFSSALYLALSVALVLWAATAAARWGAWCNLASAALFTIGSFYFVVLSYPETMMLTMTRALRADVVKLSCRERVCTANEMLLATWSFLFAFAPYFALAGYYLAVGDVGPALAYLLSTAVFIAMMLVWVVAAMPKSIQANGGRGSSHCYDLCCRPCCCLSDAPLDGTADGVGADEAKKKWGAPAYHEAFCARHCGSDFLVGSFLFLALGTAATLGCAALVAFDPASVFAWLTFVSVAPFAVGATLFVRSSYPETMNASICCGPVDWTAYEVDDDECCCDVCGCCRPQKSKGPASEPLLPPV